MTGLIQSCLPELGCTVVEAAWPAVDEAQNMTENAAIDLGCGVDVNRNDKGATPSAKRSPNGAWLSRFQPAFTETACQCAIVAFHCCGNVRTLNISRDVVIGSYLRRNPKGEENNSGYLNQSVISHETATGRRVGKREGRRSPTQGDTGHGKPLVQVYSPVGN